MLKASTGRVVVLAIKKEVRRRGGIRSPEWTQLERRAGRHLKAAGSSGEHYTEALIMLGRGWKIDKPWRRP